MNLGFGLIFTSQTDKAEAGIGRLTGAIDTMSGRVAAMGSQMKDVFEDLVGGLIKGGKMMIDGAAKFEKGEQMLRFAFRDLKDSAAIDGIMAEVERTGLQTFQTTNEVMDMVTEIKRMAGVNLFDPNMPKLVDQTGKEIQNAAVLLGDVASGSEFGMRSVKKGIIGIMGGNWARVAMNLDAIAGKIDEYKKAVEGAKTPTEKFIKIAPLLARDYGGAAQSLNKTWAFLESQVTDIGEKLMRTFGTPLMNQMKGPLDSFVSYFTGPNGILLPENIHKLDGIRDAFSDIGAAVAGVLNRIGRVAKEFFELTQRHPQLIKLAALIVAFVGGLAGVTAALIAAKLAISAIAFAFAGLFTVVLPVVALLGLFALVFYKIAKAKLGGEGIIDTFKRLGIVLAAAYEGLSNMSNGVAKLSEETAKSVGDKGLMGVVATLIQYGYRIKRFFEGIAAGFRESFSENGFAGKAVKALADSITHLFGTIGEVSGMSADKGSDKWQSAGHKIATVISTLVGIFAYAFAGMVTAIDYVIQALAVVWDVLKGIYSVIKDIIGPFEKVASIAGDVFGAVGNPQDFIVRHLSQTEEGRAELAKQGYHDPVEITRQAFTKYTSGTGEPSGGNVPAAKAPPTTPGGVSAAQAQGANMQTVQGNVYLDGELVGRVMDKRASLHEDRVGNVGGTVQR